MLNLTPHQNKSLQVTQVKALQTKIEETAARKFAASVALSECIRKAHEWLKGEEGKQFLKDKKLTMDEFTLAAYGFQKSFYYKLLKVGRLSFESPNTLEQFTKEVESAKNKDLGASLSIENLLNFAKEVESIKNAGKETSETSEASEASEAAAPKVTKDKPILVLNFDGVQIGLSSVSMRINADGTLKSTNTTDELKAVADYLSQYLGLKATEATPKAATPKAAKAAKPKVKKAALLLDADMTFRTEQMDLSEHA